MTGGEIIAGAALGLVIQLLHEAIKRAIDRSKTTRCILGRLNATICRITPLVVQIEKLNQEVEDSQRKVIEDLKHLFEKAVSLVDTYAELRHRNLLERRRYKKRIKEFETSLRWMVEVDVPVNQWLDINGLMAKMSEMNTKLDEITRQPSDHFLKMNQGMNHTIVEAINQSSEENDECSSDGSKPKIDIHIRWSSRKTNKDREIRFTVK